MPLFRKVVMTLTYSELGLPVVLGDFIELRSVVSRIVSTSYYIAFCFLMVIGLSEIQFMK